MTDHTDYHEQDQSTGSPHPEMAKDGLIVQVRPFCGRISRAQADAIASLAAAHGNGLLDLTDSATLQIRGVSRQSHPALINGLKMMRLIDPDPDVEIRRNILVTPFWRPQDEVEILANQLTAEIAANDASGLRDEIRFAVDTGRTPVLQNDVADIRLETDAGGSLLLVADGMKTGKPVTTDSAVAETLKLARWFSETAEDKVDRLKSLVAKSVIPAGAFVPRQQGAYNPVPGYTPNGALVGLASGQMHVETLSSLAKHGGLRLTPWRLILVESARELPEIDGIETDSGNRL
ncbi:precorrin-3B synthase [Sulfitobacter sp. F26169L]|uniref:precorrin-3B synthase n=1 Tax=Sulfitobacter sp. F26169L TaxID=2996015 RepID=UPI0022609F1F|nr:precorrin-3B synthase [Sulfitobacter sp. F26169L]MCX7565749.1 precorrin-3B synthase [Sulfitobacter sp. F26169L]